MTRRLILFRHAKSSWPDGVDDHERPLGDRGRGDAPRMARWLSAKGFLPSLALVSTARRTQQTWTLAAPELGGVAKRDEAAIYEAPAERLLELIRVTEPTVATLMILGRNPGMEDLAALLMGDDGGEAGQRLRAKFPTAGIAVLSLPIDDWAEAARHIGTLEAFVTPKSVTTP